MKPPPVDRECLTTATTWLFVPANRPDRFDRAADSGADVVIIDLQDAVPVSERASAVEPVDTWLMHGRAAVRIDDVDRHGLVHARRLADKPGLMAIVVPMTDDASVLARVAEAAPEAPLVALVESASGLANIGEIAAVPAVRRILFGHLDFAADLGSQTTRTAMLFARSQIVLASRLNGLGAPVDGVTTQVTDDDLCLEDARHGRELGMGGKLCVHPRQISIVRKAYNPSADELVWAQRVLDAIETAGDGVSVVDGAMVDGPVIRRARATLARHELGGHHGD